MIDDKETCCFMHLLCRFVNCGKTYLLPVSSSEAVQSDKVLLGYYDDEYVYFIPSVVIGAANTMLHRHHHLPFNMRKIQRNLFALNLIKVHWILSAEVSYRPQKRVGTTRRRYITFYKKPLYEFMAGVNGRIDA